MEGAGEAASDRGNGFDDASVSVVLRSSKSISPLGSIARSGFFSCSRSFSSLPVFFFRTPSFPSAEVLGDADPADAPFNLEIDETSCGALTCLLGGAMWVL